MKKELLILAICITLVTSAFVLAKPNKNVYDAKETGNRSFVNIVGDSFPGGGDYPDNIVTGWVQYSKKLPHLHTTWQIDGLIPGDEYQLKITCKWADARLAYAEGTPNIGYPWMSGYWGSESFAVMEIVTADDQGHIGYGFDYAHLPVGDYYDIQFIITANDGTWYSAWTWENSDDTTSHDGDYGTDIHFFTIKEAEIMLVEKDPYDWSVVEGGAYGILVYHEASNDFDYDFNGYGLETETAYTLIYYPEPQTTWPWPIVIIDAGTTDTNGEIMLSGTYGFDSMENFKIWLVLTSDLIDIPDRILGWNPTEYLFEYDLISYYETIIP